MTNAWRAGRGKARRALIGLIVAVATLVPGGAEAAVAGGDVLAYGAPDHGSMEGAVLNAPIVGMAAAPNGSGYWLVASDGGVFTFGGAHYVGSLGNIPLNQPIVGMAPTPTGRGYWLVASDGGVFALGDAPFLGSAGANRISDPVVAIAANPTLPGYWLVTSGGAVFGYGVAPHHGDLTNARPGRPVVDLAVTPTGNGYWLATDDGGVFTFGAATFAGSLGGQPIAEPITGIEAASAGSYWLVARDGAVFAYGGAPFAGAASNACKDAVFGMAPRRGGGYWLGTTPLAAATITPSMSSLQRTAAESAQLTSLLRLRQGCQPGAAARRGVLAHPLPGSRITGSYGWRTHPIHRAPQLHTGTDFAGGSAALAAATGTVVEVRLRHGYGLTIVVDHGNGVATAYSHLASSHVGAGEVVRQGQAIGVVGRSGDATGAHLHFEVRVHGQHTDPLSWL